MGQGTDHQPGVLAGGMALSALLALAVIVAVWTASMFTGQVRELGSSPSDSQAPATLAYEPR
jgi:hypothetical protein